MTFMFSLMCNSCHSLNCFLLLVKFPYALKILPLTAMSFDIMWCLGNQWSSKCLVTSSLTHTCEIILHTKPWTNEYPSNHFPPSTYFALVACMVIVWRRNDCFFCQDLCTQWKLTPTQWKSFTTKWLRGEYSTIKAIYTSFLCLC